MPQRAGEVKASFHRHGGFTWVLQTRSIRRPIILGYRMPLIQVNARDETLDWDPAEVVAALAASPTAPVIVMIHGYKFLPGDPVHCPHTHILALQPTRESFKAVSWPRRLGVGRPGDGPEPICIAFGWSARGAVWQAWRQSDRAAAALATLVTALSAAHPGRKVHIIAHSMGARVALGAMRHVARGAIGRVVLMAGAALRSDAAAALDSPAGATAEVINITSRGNDLFDLLLQLALWTPARTLGAGLARPQPNWVDIQIDAPGVLVGLRGLGLRIAPPNVRICHWSGYLRPGLFGLYRRYLAQPETLPLSALAAALPRQRPRRFPWLTAPPRTKGPGGAASPA